MTSVFSAIAMPKGGRFLRKPDFLRSRTSEDGLNMESRRPLDPDELFDVDEKETDPDLSHLNTALHALVDIFPDVQPDVFREMLLSLSDQSRLEVVTEHLLRNGAHYIQGRYRKKVDDANIGPLHDMDLLPKQETFRSNIYKHTVKAALYREFSSLSHSSIKAVLAEHNYSYTLARPTLQQLSSRSWRSTLSSLLFRKRSALSDIDSHPCIEWVPDSVDPQIMRAYFKRTGSIELDRELYKTYIAPVLARQNQERQDRDEAYACQLNEAQAEEADAMFDCECCFTPSPFEQISTCDSEACHYICFRCVKHAANEALHGQGWARNVDLAKSSLRCLAPSVPDCQGCITPELARRALCTERDGLLNWQKLQERVASENLIKSQLPLLTCPFCPYAELDEPSRLILKTPTALARHVLRLPLDPAKALAAFLFICIYPLMLPLMYLLLGLSSMLAKATHGQMQASRTRVVHRRRGLRFVCQSPTCKQSSCTNCGNAWTDPHTCHETSLQSLRQCIENATTSSVKRTCPKCNLSFVKSSGCNKLVCNCGYTMCYVCRQEIGREGYGHFCQHFRELGGRCTECDRCDLYIVENEDGVIRRAAMQAEKEWLEREGKGTGGGDKDKFGAVVADVIAGTNGETRRDYEAWLDSCMEMVLE